MVALKEKWREKVERVIKNNENEYNIEINFLNR